MKSWEKLLSDDMTVVCEGIDDLLSKIDNRNKKQFAKVAERYYDGDHDILSKRIFYLDDHDNLVEDSLASNVRIPHQFFTENVDQKTQYLLSNNVEIKTENDQLEELLQDYIDEDYQLFLDEIVEGASVKGAEYAYARITTADRLKFQISDSNSTDTVFNDDLEEVAVVRRYYKTILQNDKDVVACFAEIYTEKDIRYAVSIDRKPFEPDMQQDMNPRPHVVGVTDDNKPIERNYGRIPFFRLANNRKEISDLKPIKALIDDYDLMASSLSENLENYDRPFFVVTGYQGEDVDKIRRNIKSKGVIKAGAPNTAGDLQVRTYQIPYDARKAKLDIDREAIYKFGMAFDSTQGGGSNITNVDIKSRYSLLDLKCNKIEPRLRALIKWTLELILQDVARRGKGSFDIHDIEVEINRNMIFNESDEINDDLVEAQTKQTLISSLILAAQYIPLDEVTKQICDIYDIDYELIQAEIDEYGLQSLSREEPLNEQMAEGNS